MADSGNDAAYGQHGPQSDTGGYNVLQFIVDQALRKINAVHIVQIKKVTVEGVVGPIGNLDAAPMVNMLDGAGRKSDHGTIHNLAYFRLSGGKKSIIMDPKVGDIGVAVIADRDISAVKKNKKTSNPGSKRRFDMADGIYLSTIIADSPTSYIQFKDDGTIVLSPDNGTTVITVKAGLITGIVSNAGEFVVAADHAQIKQHGVPDMHFTVDISSGRLLIGKALVIASDPFPGD